MGFEYFLVNILFFCLLQLYQQTKINFNVVLYCKTDMLGDFEAISSNALLSSKCKISLALFRAQFPLNVKIGHGICFNYVHYQIRNAFYKGKLIVKRQLFLFQSNFQLLSFRLAFTRLISNSKHNFFSNRNIQFIFS